MLTWRGFLSGGSFMRTLLTALEPEPTWFGELDYWIVDQRLISKHDAADLAKAELAHFTPPQVGYIWTEDGAFNTQEELPTVLSALQQIAPVFLWTWIPFRSFPEVGDPLPTLPGLWELHDSTEK